MTRGCSTLPRMSIIPWYRSGAEVSTRLPRARNESRVPLYSGSGRVHPPHRSTAYSATQTRGAMRIRTARLGPAISRSMHVLRLDLPRVCEHRSSCRLLPKYRRYHRPIVSSPRSWCDRFVVTDSIGFAQNKVFRKARENDNGDTSSAA